MKFLEKNLEDIIFETDNDDLILRGLPIEGRKIRQLRIGNYGISDLITIQKEYEAYSCINSEATKEIYKSYPYLIISVYELKKGEVNLNTYHQALRYVRGIKSYLNQRKFYIDFRFRIVLIGKEICKKSTLIYLPDVHSNIEIYQYDYKFDGIIFTNQEGYRLTDEGFKL